MVDPVERLPVVDKCNLVMLAVTSDLERMLVVAPLCTMVAERNGDDTASNEWKIRKKKNFIVKTKENFALTVVLGKEKKFRCAPSQTKIECENITCGGCCGIG